MMQHIAKKRKHDTGLKFAGRTHRWCMLEDLVFLTQKLVQLQNRRNVAAPAESCMKYEQRYLDHDAETQER